MTSLPRILVIACGALAKELLAIIDLNGLRNLTVECLPARLHNEPDQIPGAVKERIDRARGENFSEILIGYADCGTGGRLQRICDEESVSMLTGAHCYQFFAGNQAFLDMHDEAPGTLYLTDFLARHFDRLIWSGFGIADHPELLDIYFANYTRLVYLAQQPTPDLEQLATNAASRLGLAYEMRLTGYGELEASVVDISRSRLRPEHTDRTEVAS